MINSSQKGFISMLCLLCILSACNLDKLEVDNITAPDLTPTVIAPLGFFEYTMEELLEEISSEEVTVFIDDDQKIFLTYRDSAEFSVPTDLVDIEDVDGSGSIFPDTTVIPVDNNITVPFSETFTYTYEQEGEERLDSIFYRSGEIDFEITSTCNCTVSFDFVINNTRNTSSDSPVRFFGTVLPAAAGGTSQENYNRDLSGYKTVLDNDSSQFSSVLEGEIVIAPGQQLLATDVLRFNFTYKDQEFSRVFGFFGRDTIALESGIIELDLFDDTRGTGIILEGPTFTMDVANRVGIPMGILLDSVYAANNDGDTVFLSGRVPNSPQTIGFNETDFLEPEMSTITVNPQNSNIREFFEIAPSVIAFPLTAVSNIDNQANFNYLTDSSDIKANLSVSLPLSFRLEDFTQELDFEIGGEVDLEEADSLFLQLFVQNDLPFIATVSMAVKDSTDKVLFAIPGQEVLTPPIVNAAGEITGPSQVTSRFDLGREGTQALKNGETLSVNLILNTPGSNVNRFFSVLSTNSIRAEIGLGGLVKVEL